MSSALAPREHRCASRAVERFETRRLRLDLQRGAGDGYRCSRELGLVQLGHDAARYLVEFATT